jgi:predicted nucleic acid-binding protein
MITALVDTTVIVHLYRRYAPALTWYGSQLQGLGITPITWMEVIDGAGSKAKQIASKTILSQFEITHLTAADQDWAIRQMEQYRLSHGVGTNDCLIAAVAYRLQVPLYTHNLKDMTPIIGKLAVQPYA